MQCACISQREKKHEVCIHETWQMLLLEQQET